MLHTGHPKYPKLALHLAATQNHYRCDGLPPGDACISG